MGGREQGRPYTYKKKKTSEISQKEMKLTETFQYLQLPKKKKRRRRRRRRGRGGGGGRRRRGREQFL